MEYAAVLAGMTISVMLMANAALQTSLGFGALVVIHVVGLAAILPLALWKAPRPSGPVPWPLFTGGLVGVALVGLNNVTVPLLGAGLTVALSVVGQLSASAAVDHRGWFGLPRVRFCWQRAAGLTLAIAGVGLMTLGGGE